MNQLIFKKFVFLAGCLAIMNASFAWGKTGHNIVAQIAFRLINDSTKSKVQTFLGNTTFEDAANWMDSMRSNSAYDFMKPWHYLDFDSGQLYSRPPTDDNIVTRLSLSFGDLQHYTLLCDRQVTTDLLYLFHLIGDLHQPLHTGYNSDKGGNLLAVDFMHTPYKSAQALGRTDH